MTSSLVDASDEDLMATYQRGEQVAFDVLYRRHSAKIYGFLKARVRQPGVADDLFQATFMKLHQSRSSYNPSFPFVPWLFTICRSVMIDSQRKTMRNLEDLDEEAIERAVAITPPHLETGPAAPGLDGLPPEQRRAVELRYGEESSFEEIAARLETTPSNARQLVSRAIRKLRSMTGKNGDENG